MHTGRCMHAENPHPGLALREHRLEGRGENHCAHTLSLASSCLHLTSCALLAASAVNADCLPHVDCLTNRAGRFAAGI